MRNTTLSADNGNFLQRGKMKDSFVFYSSYADAILQIDSAESQIKVLKAIWDFAFKEIEPLEGSLNTIESIIFSMAKPTIEASKRNYENGLKGGRPRKTPLKTPLKTPVLTNDNDNKNLNEYYNDSDNKNLNDYENINNSNVNNIKKSPFKKPTLEKIIRFCEEKNLGLDPQEFFYYYEKRKWENVYNWQSLIIRWNENQISEYMSKVQKNQKQTQTSSSDPYAALR